MRKSTKTNDGITAIYVRRSVSDKDKGNNSLSISAQKEECIRQLMDGVSGSDEFKTCKKLCTPLTAKDLAGRKLNNQIIYYLNTHRGLDFAAEAVKQASNSESLINSIREDYIRRLINGESNFNVREISEKVC